MSHPSALSPSSRAARLLVRSLSLFTIVLLWQATAWTGLFNTALFPPPMEVAQAFVEMVARGELWPDLTASCRRALLGYIAGCSIGIVLGTITGRIVLLDRLMGPVMNVLRAFPSVAIVPLAITWFGLSELSKYFLVAWGVLFPVWVTTHAGMSQVDRTYLWAAQSLGANNRQLIWEVLLPAALPHTLAGMRAAIGLCFICVFVAEMAGAYEGIGFRISTSYLIFRTDKMLASLIVLGILGACADLIFQRACSWLFPWTRLHGRLKATGP
jgi:ABC-type nitrate/sulfonate/bicarbonate transport system permease component